MVTLRIEHRIADYNRWKQAFDSDPIDRRTSGVTSYRICQPENDDLFVIIDLDFELPEQAQRARIALEKIFPRIEGSLIFGARMSLFHQVESVEL